uniref:RNA-directed DNA polymerase n=1 Tax=Leptospira santarosai serovar Arenal str. MAVJ 401 TaxID=1049976 RepID=M6JVS2_9LEPT|nr:RNA-directed DNA polymerase [Leptospira santarosai serovar Arenal str. MAVJ 401]
MHRNEESVYTKICRIGLLASKDKKVCFTSLAHLLTPEYLKDSYMGLNKKASAGEDGVTMEEYGLNLDENIERLHESLKTGKYRADSVRRVYIPKSDGKMRPLGIPTVKDKVLQKSVSGILNMIYEPYFCDFSYGFRPQRSCHQALARLKEGVNKREIRWIIDADIKAYFDNVNHKWMLKFLRHRISDRKILQLVSKWLRAGILDNGLYIRNENGTPQGGVVSPILANIYLHYVLDLWYVKKVKSGLKGDSMLIRYADDFVVGFEHKSEAEFFLNELRKRFSEFGLSISEEKTKLVEFGKLNHKNGKKGPSIQPRTFNFLGFTAYMRKVGKSNLRYRMAYKPSRKSRNKFLRNVKEWLIRNRESSEWYQAKYLSRALKGYYNYFGMRYCLRSLKNVKWHLERSWISQLRRRSQRHNLFWKRIKRIPWFICLPEPSLR